MRYEAWPHTYVEIDQEIISMIILPFPLIQEGHCHLMEKVCAQVLVNNLEDWICAGKVWEN